jgi:hypothetical protein
VRFNRGRNQAQTIRIDKLHCRQVFYLNFKGTPSREEHKIGFSVLTTIELNLPVEFTKFCKRRTPYIEFKKNMKHQLRAKSYELKALSYELRHIYKLRVTSYELLNTNCELRAKICDKQKHACAG